MAKANVKRGEEKVVLGGVERVLRYDMNSLVELEEKMGMPLSELGNVAVTMRNVRSMLWAGLIHAEPELTESEVGGLVDMGNMVEVQEAIGKAFGQATAKN